MKLTDIVLFLLIATMVVGALVFAQFHKPATEPEVPAFEVLSERVVW